MEYTVKKGDSLWKIGKSFGFDDGMPIADHPDNAHLFEGDDKDVNRINIGDKLFIPKVNSLGVRTEVNKAITSRTGSKNGYLRLKVNDVFDEPLKDFKYEVQLGDFIVAGDQTTHSGDIEIELPRDKTKRISPLWPKNKTDSEIEALSEEERVEHNTGLLKLYVNNDDPEEYFQWNINRQYEAEDSPLGQQQQLANANKFGGNIAECKAEYLPEKDESMMSAIPTEALFSSEIPVNADNTDDLPLSSPVNLSPEYYAATWEYIRYNRITQLADGEYKKLKDQFEEAKNGDGAYDVLEVKLQNAKMDVEYYNHCLYQWLDDIFNVREPLQSDENLIDVIIKKNSLDTVDLHLKELTSGWAEDINAENSIQALLDMSYMPVRRSVQSLNLYASTYNHQDKVDELTTHIVSPPMTSRVRLCYKDDPTEPISNSYVLYWRYAKNGTDIETGHEEYYKNASIMMPIGIGRTDADGYLVQSAPFGSRGRNRYGDIVEPLIHINDNQFSIDLDAEAFAEGKNSNEFIKKGFQSEEHIDKLKEMIANIDGNNVSFDEMFWRLNEYLPEYMVERNLLFNWHYNSIDDAESYVELQENMQGIKEANEDFYEGMRARVSNHLFNYYSSGQQDTYGFMVMPPSVGLMKTEDLAELGNTGDYVYKGAINPPSSPDVLQKPIELHCTLNEWNRRLIVANESMKDAVEKHRLFTKSHMQNIDNLGRMGSLLNLYIKFPYEEQANSITKEKEEVLSKVNKLSEAIKNITLDPDEGVDEGIFEALAAMEKSQKQIIKLLTTEEFRLELKLYQDQAEQEDGGPSPYMAVDESWQAVYGTVADSLNLIASTKWADDAFEQVIEKPLEGLVYSDTVTGMLKAARPAVEKAMGEKVDTIVVNSSGESIQDTLDVIQDRFDNYVLEDYVEQPSTLLGEILQSKLYEQGGEVKGILDTFVNNIPGPSSVLGVIIDSYSAFIHKKIKEQTRSNGYHVRLLLASMRRYGMLSEKAKVPIGQIVEGILRTNTDIRANGKIVVKKASLNQYRIDLNKLNETIKKNQEKVDEQASKLSKSRNSKANSKQHKKGIPQRRRNYEAARSSLKAQKSTAEMLRDKIKLEEQARALTEALTDENERLKTQIKLAEEVKDLNAEIAADRKKIPMTADEFYAQYDGRFARGYKTVLMLFNWAALYEDYSKLIHLNEDQSIPDVEYDVVIATTIRTLAISAGTASASIMLANRWLADDEKFGKKGFLNTSAAEKLGAHADRFVVAANIITIYLSSRELYETWDYKLGIERLDASLDILGNTLTTLGYILMEGAKKYGSHKILGHFFGMALLPGFGMLLMGVGALLFIIQAGIAIYGWARGVDYRKNRPVGYYFWKEFKQVLEHCQRYDDEDHYLGESETETEAFRELLNVYNSHDSLGDNQDGWGHLSWRASVPLLVSWHKPERDVNDIIDVIEDVAKVPDVIVESSADDPEWPLYNQYTTDVKLLSPEAFTKFYLHLKRMVDIDPNRTWQFSINTKTYQGVISALESGTYIPLGETDEIMQYLKGIDDTDVVSSGSSFGNFYTTSKNIAWDHPHFSIKIN